MSDTKRYYWLKLKEDFFRQKEIKQLRKIAGGPVYTIIYLKMLLRCMSENGRLYFEGVENDFASELALDIDESVEDVRMTLNFLQAKGILVQCNAAEWEVLTAKEMTGSECDSARRMRRMRQQNAIVAGDKKLLASHSDDESSHSDSDVTARDTEIEKEIDKRDKSKSKRKTFKPPTGDEVREYANAVGFTRLDVQYFLDYYETSGWRRTDGKPVLNWKQTVLTWKKRDEERHPEFYKQAEENKEQPFDWRNLSPRELMRLQDEEMLKDQQREGIGLFK